MSEHNSRMRIAALCFCRLFNYKLHVHIFELENHARHKTQLSCRSKEIVFKFYCLIVTQQPNYSHISATISIHSGQTFLVSYIVHEILAYAKPTRISAHLFGCFIHESVTAATQFQRHIVPLPVPAAIIGTKMKLSHLIAIIDSCDNRSAWCVATSA